MILFFVKIKLRKCCFFKSFFVNPQGLAKGLALSLKEECNVFVIHLEVYFLHAYIYNSSINSNIDVLFVYISNVEEVKTIQFTSLINYRSSIGNYFVIIGDFNSILSAVEKEGGTQFTHSNSLLFRNFIKELGLIDLGYKGSGMTWSNKGEGVHHIKERLD